MVCHISSQLELQVAAAAVAVAVAAATVAAACRRLSRPILLVRRREKHLRRLPLIAAHARALRVRFPAALHLILLIRRGAELHHANGPRDHALSALQRGDVGREPSHHAVAVERDVEGARARKHRQRVLAVAGGDVRVPVPLELADDSEVPVAAFAHGAAERAVVGRFIIVTGSGVSPSRRRRRRRAGVVGRSNQLKVLGLLIINRSRLAQVKVLEEVLFIPQLGASASTHGVAQAFVIHLAPLGRMRQSLGQRAQSPFLILIRLELFATAAPQRLNGFLKVARPQPHGVAHQPAVRLAARLDVAVQLAKLVVKDELCQAAAPLLVHGVVALPGHAPTTRVRSAWIELPASRAHPRLGADL
mmetsp:Transcript_8103/g.24954  ORF Transcript_8103/g.24954 Transcript_8103/m.24954 type:complete len:361 (-) Transcript_8103:1211-2293(-)